MNARFRVDTGTHNSTIHSVQAARNGKVIVSASRDGMIRVWDAESRGAIRKILGKPLDSRSQWMEQAVLLDLDRYVLAHSRETAGYPDGNSRLEIFQIATGNMIQVHVANGMFSYLAVSDDSRYLMVTGKTPGIHIYDLEKLVRTGELELLRFISSPEFPWALAVNRVGADYQVAYASSVEGRGKVIRVSLSYDVVVETDLPEMSGPDLLAVDGKGNIAVCERFKESIWIIDPQGKPAHRIPTKFYHTALEFSPDGKYLVVGAEFEPGGGRGFCHVYETDTWKETATYSGHDSQVTSLAFMGSEQVITAGGSSREIHIWNVHSGESQGMITGTGQASMITGWDDELLGFCRVGDDQIPQPGLPPESTRYFDLNSFKLRPVTGSSKTSNAIADAALEALGLDYMGPYAKQGDWLATSGEDQTISLWHMPDIRTELKSGLAAPALKLFVSRDDDWIIWSRSGFYASSLKGDSFYGLHVQEIENQEGVFYPIDRFIKQLYRPAVIHAILETGSEARALEVLKLEPVDILPLLPPVVELISPQPGATDQEDVELQFEVRPAREPVERVWVLKDDQFLWEERGSNVRQGGRFIVPARLLPGENRFKVLAESKATKSLPALLWIEHKEPTSNWDTGMFSFGGPPTLGIGDTGDPDDTLSVQVSRILLDVSVTGGKHGLEATLDGESVWESSTGGVQTVDIPVTKDSGQIEIWETGKERRRLYTLQLSPVVTGRGSRGAGGPSIASATVDHLPNLYLLSIGVSKLKKPRPDLDINNLDFAHVDAESVSSRFKDQKGTLYEDVIVKQLVNEKATRSKILAALKDIQEQVARREEIKSREKIQVKDLVVVFLAGHGVEIDHEYYFWCHDLDTADPRNTGISVMELGTLITGLPGEVIFLIDTCRAGSVGRELIQNLDPNVLAKLLISLNERAQYILTATERDTPSFEDSAYGHGYFTQGILDAFRQLPDVTALLLADFVQERVKVLSEGDQIPVAQVYGEIYRRSIFRK